MTPPGGHATTDALHGILIIWNRARAQFATMRPSLHRQCVDVSVTIFTFEGGRLRVEARFLRLG